MAAHFDSDSDFLKDILGEEPRLAFFARQPQFSARSPLQGQFFSQRFDDFFNEFLGGLGRELQTGQNPTQSFDDFLGGINFDQRFQSLPPQLRGDFSQQRIAPLTRQLFF